MEKHVREIFRNEIREVIQSEYKIYAMRARLGVDGVLYLQQHFYELNGRVFQPYGEIVKCILLMQDPKEN